MKPVDFRNETFAAIQNRIAGQRAAVLVAWQTHGPATTHELAYRSRISLLSLRRANQLIAACVRHTPAPLNLLHGPFFKPCASQPSC